MNQEICRGRWFHSGKDLAIILLLLMAFILLLLTEPDSCRGQDEDCDRLMLFPSYGYHSENKSLCINIHGWIYKPEDSSVARSMMLSGLKGLVDIENESENALFQKRVRKFLVDNQRGREIEVRLFGKKYTLGPSRPNGHIEGEISVSVKKMRFGGNKPRTLSLEIVRGKDIKYRITHNVDVLPLKGITIISDIDDTVKITCVRDKKEAFRNTFLREFRAVPGMSSLYRKWHKRGYMFHYVSGSPWQIYPSLCEFFDANGFPRAYYHLKDFRLKDSSSLRFLIGDQLEYKKVIIEDLMRQFPFHRFILVGDSGERDPEVYAGIVKKFRERVKAVLIRDLGDVPDNNKRYERLYKGLPVKFKSFKRVSEIRRWAETL